jgi:hypothetical protein
MSSTPYIVYGSTPRRSRLLARLAALLALLVAVAAAVVFVVLEGAGQAGQGASRSAQGATSSQRKLVTHPVKRTASVRPARSRPAARKPVVIPPPASTPVVVLNANGVHGAAQAAASRLAAFGYPTPVVTNAATRGLPTTIMYRHGFGPAARTLARRIGGVKVVEPLDGISPTTLASADLVLVVGS